MTASFKRIPIIIGIAEECTQKAQKNAKRLYCNWAAQLILRILRVFVLRLLLASRSLAKCWRLKTNLAILRTRQ